MRRKRRALLESQSHILRIMGIYTAVILLIFAIFINFIGQEKVVMGTGEAIQPPVSENHSTDIRETNQTLDTARLTTDSGLKSPISSTSNEPRTADSGPGSQSSAANADPDKMIWPVKGKVIQQFGMAYSSTYSDYRFHNGLDIRVDSGSKIVAVRAGKVIAVEDTGNEAAVILVDHGSGWQSRYAHLAGSTIKPGTAVKSGQVLGSVEEPGLSEVLDGPHLHFELIKDGQAVNPLDYLPSGNP